MNLNIMDINMIPKITDITNLFIDDFDEIEEFDEDLAVYLWYRSNELFDIKIFNKKCKKLINDCFDEMSFPEYIPIAYVIYNYLKIHKYDIKDRIVHVMVDEKSQFAKGHDDPMGFVQLFTFIFKNFQLIGIQVNATLVTEKIDLSGSKKQQMHYFDDNAAWVEGDKENDTQCVICMSSKGDFIETPCNHKYHLNCIRCTPKLICPLCKTNLIDFLKTNGITQEEITKRLNDEIRDNKLTNFHDALNTFSEDEVDMMDDMDFARLCLEMLKLNEGNIVPYNHIILDMNANASKLFAEISSIKSKKEKGCFMYVYENPIEFIIQTKNPYAKSVVDWLPISKLNGTPFKEPILKQINQIKNFNEQYVVVIVFDNIINIKLMDNNLNKDAIRINHNDILQSLMRCNICRCSGDTPNAPNREYKWAKSVLNNMKKKHNKNIEKYKNKKKFKSNIKIVDQ